MDAFGLAVIGLAALALGGGVGVLTARRQRRAGQGGGGAIGRAMLNGGLAIVAVGIVLGKLHPLRHLGAAPVEPTVSLMPLVSVFDEPALALLQIAVFVPLGALLALRFPTLGLLRLTLAGALLATLIEAVQLLHPLRRTLLDDVIVSALGALLGSAPVVAARRRPRGAASQP
ncbi:MAG TPA: VanZ family protein [Egibacteraceae bacterium]|nr:VanZ family protein [Egibacteraceae bacterium]